MTLAVLDGEKTAAIRRRYGGPAQVKHTRKFRGQRKWTDDEDTFLYQRAAGMTVKQLCREMGRTDFSVRSRLKALGLRPLLERVR